MTGTQKAIFPGIIVISITLFFLNRLVNPLSEAIAATEPAPAPEIEPLKEQPIDLSLNCAFQNRYPPQVQSWCMEIEKISTLYGVDPLLVAAVMLVESGGQPEVISHSGAVGLMQVMPSDGLASTFQCINGPCFANRPTIAELLDPFFNLDYGVRMLAGLINRTGSIREALRSYGPYDVEYGYADKVLAIYSEL